MSESIHEMHEHAEKAREASGLVLATFTMSVMAVLVAAISVLGHRAHTRTLLDQTKATDTWAEYQARNIRRHNNQLFIDLDSIMVIKNPTQAAVLERKYGADVQRYEKSLAETRKRAENFETDAVLQETKASRFDLGEVLLEAALVITSITLITRKNLFWGMGSVMALAGLLLAISSAWVH
jgi:NAD(P)H-dependent FMN reductase